MRHPGKQVTFGLAAADSRLYVDLLQLYLAHLNREPLVLTSEPTKTAEQTATQPPFKVVDEHGNTLFVEETREPESVIRAEPGLAPEPGGTPRNRKERRKAAALARRRR